MFNIEDAKISVLAEKRIEEILKNPTANFYDTPSSNSATSIL